MYKVQSGHIIDSLLNIGEVLLGIVFCIMHLRWLRLKTVDIDFSTVPSTYVVSLSMRIKKQQCSYNCALLIINSYGNY